MANEWTIRKGDVGGGKSGQELDGCSIRVNEAGTAYEFLAVVARTAGTELPTVPFTFAPFAYNGLVWNIEVQRLETDQAIGQWGNNKRTDSDAPQDESGTWTAQAGSGLPEDEGKEGAASASA